MFYVQTGQSIVGAKIYQLSLSNNCKSPGLLMCFIACQQGNLPVLDQ